MTKKNNFKLKGIGAAPGITIARAYLFNKEVESVSDLEIDNIEEAKENLEFAISKSKKELKKVFSLAVDKLGEKRAAIFEAQIMILDDQILLDTINNRIEKERKSPEYIVNDEISKYQDLMNASHTQYMRERSQDIEDIKNRIIRNLKKKKWQSRITEDVIVISQSITPADTLLFSRANVKGYVTDFGGLTSHAAIVARSLNVPAVVGVHDASSSIHSGDIIIVDGFHGEVVINPSEEQLQHYESKISKLSKFDAELTKLKEEPAVTIDGREIKIMANLDISDEIDQIISRGAEGIGLVRTEQLFDEYDQYPDEEEQFAFYSQLSENFYPETVVIRAFDIGGDKVLPVDVKEPNPFLGWRGIRFLLDNQKLFKTQIRAVLRASEHMNIDFMIPMVTSIAEIRKSKTLITECENELLAEGIKYNKNMSIGIMIEVPSAAVLTKEFAAEVDFISIGTNDLIQYLLAVDRGNEIVSALYQEFHPAVVRTLRFIINDAKSEKVGVSICGEMAADPLAVPLLIGLGLKSISVSASAVPLIKRLIRSMKYEDVKLLAEECLQLVTENEIKSKLNKYFEENLKQDSKETYSR